MSLTRPLPGVPSAIMMKAWVNGKFVDRDHATVSIFDAGLQHGVGLFETMLAENGRVYRAEAHLKRLANSARELRLTDDLRIRPLVEAVHLTVRESGFEKDRARVRLTLTGGDLNLLQSERRGPSGPTIIITAQPATPYPDQLFDQGVRVVIADGRLNPFEATAGHKTLNYWTRLRALQESSRFQAGEALWLSVTNHLMCGCVSNVFIVKDGTLFTPIARGEEPDGGVPSPVLPGITRAAIMEFADQERIGVSKQMLDVNGLVDADEVFLTNASWGVLPVVSAIVFEENTIGSGAPGPITQRMRELWLSDFRERTTLTSGVDVEDIGRVPDRTGTVDPLGEILGGNGETPGRDGRSDASCSSDESAPPHSPGSRINGSLNDPAEGSDQDAADGRADDDDWDDASATDLDR
ncbi:MAG: aminotransferase class IV [Planctomycetota bacterium]